MVLQKIVENFMDETQDKCMDIRTAKVRKTTSEKGKVVKDGIIITAML